MKGKKILLLFVTGVLLILTGLILGRINYQDKSKLNNDQQNIVQDITQEISTVTPQEKITVLVTKVIDGDTIEIEGGQKVRYIGIDTPEKGQPFFDKAKKFNSDLVLHRNVEVEFDIQTKDKYGRTLAYVFIEQFDSRYYRTKMFVNLELIKKGLAAAETIQPNVKYQDKILNVQKESREKCLGIWEELCF